MVRRKSKNSEAPLAGAVDGAFGSVSDDSRPPTPSVRNVKAEVLREVHALYVGPKKASSDAHTHGLVEVASALQLPDTECRPPRRKIRVMIVGNHSSGKSSFCNYASGEHVQKTGVAIESQGFTLITRGRKRETLKGSATVELFPFLRELAEKPGVREYLHTELAISTKNKFPLVTLIDTPGLVDGNLKYPFNVEESILWMADHCDLILVFFDPQGLALCRRTLRVVEALNKKNSEKLRYYLTRADEVVDEKDRQKVITQITMDLAPKVKNQTAFELPTIYIPEKAKSTHVPNHLDEVFEEIDKTIDYNVQNTLDTLEKDCKLISKTIDQVLTDEEMKRKRNSSARNMGALYLMTALFFPAMLLFFLGARARSHIPDYDLSSLPSWMTLILSTLASICDSIPSDQVMNVVIATVVGSLVFFLMSKWKWRYQPVKNNAEIKQLLEHKTVMETTMLETKKTLYTKYLNATAGNQNFY